jgi:hypothetical protein
MFLEVHPISGFDVRLTPSSVAARKQILSVLSITELGVGRPGVGKSGRPVAGKLRGVVVVAIRTGGVALTVIMFSSVHNII